jgi:hypothetical protein
MEQEILDRDLPAVSPITYREKLEILEGYLRVLSSSNISDRKSDRSVAPDGQSARNPEINELRQNPARYHS